MSKGKKLTPNERALKDYSTFVRSKPNVSDSVEYLCETILQHSVAVNRSINESAEKKLTIDQQIYDIMTICLHRIHELAKDGQLDCKFTEEGEDGSGNTVKDK